MAEFLVSDHARKRYAERFPDGPGIEADLVRSAPASKAVKKRLRRRARTQLHMDQLSRPAHWLFFHHRQRDALFVCSVRGRASYFVITCFPAPSMEVR